MPYLFDKNGITILNFIGIAGCVFCVRYVLSEVKVKQYGCHECPVSSQAAVVQVYHTTFTEAGVTRAHISRVRSPFFSLLLSFFYPSHPYYYTWLPGHIQMLRRYNSTGQQTYHLTGKLILVGSSNLCDLVVRHASIGERHAFIEFHPVTQSYWLRDLGTLGGTYHNEKQLFGLIELRPADVVRFGRSNTFVFDMPAVHVVQHPSRLCNGHTTSSDAMALPVVGTKIKPKPAREKFSRFPTDYDMSDATATANSSPKSSDATGDSPLSSSQRRSTSMDPKKTSKTRAKRSGVTLPTTPTRALDNARHAPSASRGILPQILGLNVYEQNSRNKTSSNHQLLQRVVGLQKELTRKDDEILRLREMIASITDEDANRQRKNQSHARLTNNGDTKGYGSPVTATVDSPNVDVGGLQEDLKTIRQKLRHQELISNAFFVVAVEEMNGINKRVAHATPKDYSDVLLEVVKVLQDPFSYRLMEMSTRCSRVFNREAMNETEKKILLESFDNFLKKNIFPLSKAMDIFIPFMKDTAVMARDSAKACAVFSQWSREFGDQVKQTGFNADLVNYKIDDLMTRFRDNGMSRHWLPSSINPLLTLIVKEFTGAKSAMPSPAPFRQGSSTSSTTTDSAAKPKKKFTGKPLQISDFEQLADIIDRLQTEKEELVAQLENMQTAKFNMNNSPLLIRRRLKSQSPNNTPSPSEFCGIVPPLAAIVEGKKVVESPKTRSLKEKEAPAGDTPTDLENLIDRHVNEANPPSPVTISHSTTANSTPNEEKFHPQPERCPLPQIIEPTQTPSPTPLAPGEIPPFPENITDESDDFADDPLIDAESVEGDPDSVFIRDEELDGRRSKMSVNMGSGSLDI